MNITRQECCKKICKRNARTYLRGLKFDAFLSQDYLTKKGQKELNGIFHLLETLKDFSEIVRFSHRIFSRLSCKVLLLEMVQLCRVLLFVAKEGIVADDLC